MNVTVTPTKAEDKHLPAFDFTKLSALNMCPRWGLIRYDQHRRMPGEGRSTALEMGSAAHDGFAAIRLFELLEFGRSNSTEDAQSTLELVDAKGRSLFGSIRWDQMRAIIASDDDTRRRVNALAIYAVNSSGYYDDPNDKRRTLSNLETSLIAYIDRLEFGKKLPLVRDGLVGVEVPVDVTLEFEGEEKLVYQNPKYKSGPTVRDKLARIRYIGKVDGVVIDDRGVISIEENKTAARLDKSWQDSFVTSHQVTGYCVAISAMVGEPVTHATVRGMMVPLPKTYDLGGIVNMPVERDKDRFNEWFRWVWHTYSSLYLPYHDRPLEAPEYTHSCNRYFRSCSFIPLCAMASPEERELTFSQMEHSEWNPLEEATNE